MIRLLAMLLLLPVAVIAQGLGQEPDSFPVLGHVTKVAPGDVLNIRTEPDHLSERIGAFEHDAVNVEIVGTDATGRWGLVNSSETSGWVRLSFVDIPPQPKWHDFQTQLTCFGAEPFWDFEIDPGATKARYSDLDMNITPYHVTWTSDIAARLGGTMGLGSGDLNQGFSAVIENQMCHDGMSDRENALRIRLFIHENGNTYGLDGCCGLSP